MRIAVIDLGSNTCNLLIAELNGSNFKILFQGKEPVKLIPFKKNENWIREEAFSLTSLALNKHLKKIGDFSVGKTILIATSAVRDAANRDEFIEFVQVKTGLDFNVITGEQEAEFIYNGVLLAFKQIDNPSLILDIGGGSNEFIITDGKELTWKDSIPSGMARIIGLFNLSDPVSQEETAELRRFFKLQNNDVLRNCKNSQVKTLIGCSGAFDTIADVIDKVDPGTKKRTFQKIELADFKNVYKKILKSSHSERKEMKGIDKVRIDLIVPAIILIEQVVSDLAIEKIYQTDYALREGVLYDYLSM